MCAPVDNRWRGMDWGSTASAAGAQRSDECFIPTIHSGIYRTGSCGAGWQPGAVWYPAGRPYADGRTAPVANRRARFHPAPPSPALQIERFDDGFDIGGTHAHGVFHEAGIGAVIEGLEERHLGDGIEIGRASCR